MRRLIVGAATFASAVFLTSIGRCGEDIHDVYNQVSFWEPLVGNWRTVERVNGEEISGVLSIVRGVSGLAYRGVQKNDSDIQDVFAYFDLVNRRWSLLTVSTDGVLESSCTVDLTRCQQVKDGVDIVWHNSWYLRHRVTRISTTSWRFLRTTPNAITLCVTDERKSNTNRTVSLERVTDACTFQTEQPICEFQEQTLAMKYAHFWEGWLGCWENVAGDCPSSRDFKKGACGVTVIGTDYTLAGEVCCIKDDFWYCDPVTEVWRILGVAENRAGGDRWPSISKVDVCVDLGTYPRMQANATVDVGPMLYIEAGKEAYRTAPFVLRYVTVEQGTIADEWASFRRVDKATPPWEWPKARRPSESRPWISVRQSYAESSEGLTPD